MTGQGRWWWLRPGHEKHRCKAIGVEGHQCKGLVIKGGLCKVHLRIDKKLKICPVCGGSGEIL
jgi:hypothetical protein